MYGIKANFVAGLLIGAVLVIAPWAAANLLANVAMPASASTIGALDTAQPQSVNRATKSDRLHPSRKVTNEPGILPAKILEGCDPAFSPLSKGAAAANFSSRCLA